MMNPDLPAINKTTLEEFKKHAEFGRYPGKQTLFVTYRVSVYPVKEQSRGRLTVSADTVLENIFNAFNK